MSSVRIREKREVVVQNIDRLHVLIESYENGISQLQNELHNPSVGDFVRIEEASQHIKTMMNMKNNIEDCTNKIKEILEAEPELMHLVHIAPEDLDHILAQTGSAIDDAIITLRGKVATHLSGEFEYLNGNLDYFNTSVIELIRYPDQHDVKTLLDVLNTTLGEPEYDMSSLLESLETIYSGEVPNDFLQNIDMLKGNISCLRGFIDDFHIISEAVKAGSELEKSLEGSKMLEKVKSQETERKLQDCKKILERIDNQIKSLGNDEHLEGLARERLEALKNSADNIKEVILRTENMYIKEIIDEQNANNEEEVSTSTEHNDIRCPRSIDMVCEKRPIPAEESEQGFFLESKLQEVKSTTEEMQDMLKGADLTIKETERLTSVIEANAVKITTELVSEGVILAGEAEAGPPGWVADIITFVAFSCQIYDLVKSMRGSIELQKEKAYDMIDKVGKIYNKIYDKIKFYEEEKVKAKWKVGKIEKELEDLEGQFNEKPLLAEKELEVQRLEMKLDDIIHQQNSLITELELIMKREIVLHSKIENITQHMGGITSAISSILKIVKTGVEYYYEYAPLAKITEEVLEDVCKCVNEVTDEVIKAGKAVVRPIVNEIDKDIIKPLATVLEPLEKEAEEIFAPVVSLVKKDFIQPIDAVIKPAFQAVQARLLKPLEALLEQVIISNQLAQSLKQSSTEMSNQIKEGSKIIDEIHDLLDQEHKIQQELEEEKETILQHERVALWIERHPEIQKEIQKKIIPKLACYKPIPNEIAGQDRQPEILDPICNPSAKGWFSLYPHDLVVWLEHYPDDTKYFNDLLTEVSYGESFEGWKY